MKYSKYNKLFTTNDNIHLLYNSISNSFAELDSETYKNLNKLKENKIDLKELDEDLKKILIESKILVENDYDEYYEIKLNALNQRFNKNALNLTIAPTMDCNFRCTYCFEENKPVGNMDNVTEDNLISFIEKSSEKKIVFISWFGGEPLIAFDRIISITNKLVEKGFKISSDIITNGFLLEPKIADLLKENFINNLQITIDGNEDTHNKRRFLIDGGKTFEVIINNIKYLTEKHPEIGIHIRVNIDKNNYKEFNEINNYFTENFKNKKIGVYPGYVVDNNACTSSHNCNFDRHAKVEFLKEQFYSNGIKQLEFFPYGGYRECMVRNTSSYVIDYEGYLYKCWNDIGIIDQSIGNINKKGFVNNTILTRYLTAADPFEDPKCINCFYLPNCGGGCPYRRLKEKYNEAKIDYCSLHKGNIEDLLEIHYKIKKNEQK